MAENLDIVITGGKNEESIFQIMIPNIQDRSSVIDLIGKTTLCELTELIRGAVLLVGNDTSAIHLASAVRTKSVCICSGYEEGWMYPYHFDVQSSKDVYPVLVKHDYPCAKCKVIYQKMGSQNVECLKGIKKGKPALCITDITVEEVFETTI